MIDSKKLLITGVAGMIGSHLLDKVLSMGYTVIGLDDLSFGSIVNIERHLDSPNFSFYQMDVGDFEAMRKLGKDVHCILHLAAYKKISEKDLSMPSFDINGKGTENVLKMAREYGCKVLYASTSDVYGMSPDLPLSEDGDLLLGPSMIRRWSYAVSKLYGEQMAFGYYYDYQVPIIVIRYFGAFSPRSSFSWSGGHIPIFLRAILKNEEVIIHGDGSQTRSMGFVDDLVDGTILAMENENAIGEIINIGNDEELSVLDSAKLIHELANTGNDLKVRFIPMEEVFGKYKDIQRRIPNLSKARTLLGFEPKVKLKDAIRITIEKINSGNES